MHNQIIQYTAHNQISSNDDGLSARQISNSSIGKIQNTLEIEAANAIMALSLTPSPDSHYDHNGLRSTYLANLPAREINWTSSIPNNSYSSTTNIYTSAEKSYYTALGIMEREYRSNMKLSDSRAEFKSVIPANFSDALPNMSAEEFIKTMDCKVIQEVVDGQANTLVHHAILIDINSYPPEKRMTHANPTMLKNIQALFKRVPVNERGALVNARNFKEETPLHLGCSALVRNLDKIIDHLLTVGASVNAEDFSKETPFHKLCANKWLSWQLTNSIFNKLFKYSDSFYQENISRKDPLVCTLSGNEYAYSLLLNKGIQVTEECLGHAFDLPARLRTVSLDLLVGEYSDQLLQKNFKVSAGIQGINSNNGELQLRPLATSARTIFNNDQTTLNSDAKKLLEPLQLLNVLLTQEAIRYRALENSSSLHFLISKITPANSKESYLAIQESIVRGADVNAENNNKTTPLHMICSSDTLYGARILKLFLDNGGNPNIQDSLGETPLHKLCSHLEKISLLQKLKLILLIKAGANPFCKNSQYKTPYDYICENHLTSLKNWIDLQHKENQPELNVREKLPSAGDKRRYSGILTNSSIENESQNPGKRSKLTSEEFKFIGWWDLGMLSKLDELGNTPLHNAIIKKDISAIKALVARSKALGEGDKLFNIANRAGETPQALAKNEQLDEKLFKDVPE